MAFHASDIFETENFSTLIEAFLHETKVEKGGLVVDVFYQGTIDFKNDTAFHFHSRG